MTRATKKKRHRASPKKFRELVLYIARKSDGDERFGMTKLNKILFLSDFLAYRDLGEPITGQQYQALPWGPAPRRLLPELRSLEEASDCIVVEKSYHGKTQRRPVARRRADLKLFSAEEIALVDDIIDQTREASGTDLSEWSHLFTGWRAAKPNETIPYQTVFVGDPGEPMTAEEADYGRRLEQEIRASL